MTEEISITERVFVENDICEASGNPSKYPLPFKHYSVVPAQAGIQTKNNFKNKTAKENKRVNSKTFNLA
ncbi:MAG: hypothetical protein LBP40_03320 [Campylobacteraceae bacterium]|nr:hypothetical protein [Campylobacteraceae bacterium]